MIDRGSIRRHPVLNAIRIASRYFCLRWRLIAVRHDESINLICMANKNLNAAKTAKKDEFYTQLSDIERELQHYWPHFRGKTVLCNCDDPYESNFFNQPADIRRRILDYRLTVYVCEGEPSEKLAWFKTINIAGKALNEQEINNAIYAGPFVSDAKLHFSKTNCGAYRLGKDLVNGSPIRQDFLKKALEWMAAHETRSGNPMSAVGYMATHQHDPNANNLWTYFQNVLNWALTNFNLKRFKKLMKGLDWALLYDRFHDKTLDTVTLEKRIAELMADTDYEIQRPTGIIPYVLTGDEHYLDLRTFPDKIKQAVWEAQHHVCPLCHKEFELEQMEGDHIIPWSKGGRTVKENCQMLCMECNRRKGGK